MLSTASASALRDGRWARGLPQLHRQRFFNDAYARNILRMEVFGKAENSKLKNVSFRVAPRSLL